MLEILNAQLLYTRNTWMSESLTSIFFFCHYCSCWCYFCCCCYYLLLILLLLWEWCCNCFYGLVDFVVVLFVAIIVVFAGIIIAVAVAITNFTNVWLSKWRSGISDTSWWLWFLPTIAQVDNITLYVNGTEIGTDVLAVTDGEPVELQIWAGYSVPAPVIMVYIDDVVITRQFSYDTTTHVRCEGGSAGKTCPLYYVRSTKAVGSYAFNAHQHGSNLIIKTQVTGSGFPNLNRSIPLMVNRKYRYK